MSKKYYFINQYFLKLIEKSDTKLQVAKSVK